MVAIVQGGRLVAVALAVLLGAIAQGAFAQAYPARAVRMVVGFPPGQTTDLTARHFAEKLGGLFGQNFYVENRPGAGGILAHEVVKAAAPDGYTLLISSSGPLAINPSLYKSLPYDPVRDFAAIIRINTSPLYLVVNAATPVRNLAELVAWTKARPGKTSYGSGGSGTTSHIATEMLKIASGMDSLHVPFKGSPPMITALLGGQLDFYLEPAPTVVPLAKAGRVRVLAVTFPRRTDVLQEIPTIAEQGFPGFEATSWSALMAPAGTPPAIVQALNKGMNTLLAQPEVSARILANGSIPTGGPVAEFEQFIRAEIRRWGEAVKASGATAD